MSLEAFSGKAEVYAAARPGYPAAAVDYLLSLVRLDRMVADGVATNGVATDGAVPDVVVADVGAGTGKLTALLADKGVEVCGIEPNDDMRVELKKALADYPNTQVIAGSAEHTGLPDNSVDLIVCAQALHWFDAKKFWVECRRIGKPGAVVAAVYNNMDGGRGGLHRQVATDNFFTDPAVMEFDTQISYGRAQWRAYMLSHSHSPLPDDSNYAAYLAEIDAIFDAEQVNGLLTRTVTTTVYSQPVEPAQIVSIEPKADQRGAQADTDTKMLGGGEAPISETKPGAVIRGRHVAFIAITALVAIAEWTHGLGTWDRAIPMPLENDATNEQIIEAFAEMCDGPVEATPEYDDKFTAIYECPVGDSYLWLSIDRGKGDYIQYVSLVPCFLDLEPINTISGGRWSVDMNDEEIPPAIIGAFPIETQRWYCPPAEEDALP